MKGHCIIYPCIGHVSVCTYMRLYAMISERPPAPRSQYAMLNVFVISTLRAHTSIDP